MHGLGTWVIAEVMRLATSNFGYVNAGAGMSLRVMTDYSAEQRAIGVLAVLVLAQVLHALTFAAHHASCIAVVVWTIGAASPRAPSFSLCIHSISPVAASSATTARPATGLRRARQRVVLAWQTCRRRGQAQPSAPRVMPT